MLKKVKQILCVKEYDAQYVEVGDVDTEKIPDGQVLVKTVISSVSAGTEKANYIGEKHVWGNSDYILPFPREIGYSSAGVIVGVGNGVDCVNAGDRVVVSRFKAKHKNYFFANQEDLIKIPDGVSDKDAALAFIASFPLGGLRKVKLEIGESCLITGLGILGQFAVKFAKAMGANPVIATDPNPARRKLALEMGADYAFDPLDKDAMNNIKAVSGGGVNTAIEVTGVGVGLNQTLDCMKPLGRIALLGCTRNSDFTVDYYRKVHSPGITLVGAHTNARPRFDSYPNYFTQIDEIDVILKLVASKRIVLKDVVSEVHKPTECTTIYDRLVNDKNFPVGLQFDWIDE